MEFSNLSEASERPIWIHFTLLACKTYRLGERNPPSLGAQKLHSSRKIQSVVRFELMLTIRHLFEQLAVPTEPKQLDL
jgi:hypothetical protein